MWRINMIAGNISSYSRVSLNNQKSLDYIAEANLLSSCISKISVAKEIAKDAAKEKREQEQKSREGKNADDWAAFEKKNAELCKELENDLKIIGELGKGKLSNLLKYYFEDKTPNKSKKSHEDLLVMVQLALNERNKVTDKMTNEEGIGAWFFLDLCEFLRRPWYWFYMMANQAGPSRESPGMENTFCTITFQKYIKIKFFKLTSRLAQWDLSKNTKTSQFQFVWPLVFFQKKFWQTTVKLLLIVPALIFLLWIFVEVGPGKKIRPGRVFGNDPLGAVRIRYCRDGSNFCLYWFLCMCTYWWVTWSRGEGGSAVAVMYTPTYLFYLLYSRYLFPNWPRTRLKPGRIRVIYSEPHLKQTWRRKIQNDRRLGTVVIFTYYKNNLGRILNNSTSHGHIKQNRCQPWQEWPEPTLPISIRSASLRLIYLLRTHRSD